MTQHIFNAAYFFSWCLSEFGGHMFLKLLSVSSPCSAFLVLSVIDPICPGLSWFVTESVSESMSESSESAISFLANIKKILWLF